MRPTPEWWATARYLHNDGLTYAEIALQLRKSFSAVRYALCESNRKAHRKYEKKAKKRKKPFASAEQLIRWNLREKARFLAKDTGRCVQECYKEMGCL
jgi:orotate phosphoribosyltransferase-like protein